MNSPEYYIAGAWLLAGIAFWIGRLRHTMPTRWYGGSSRETGWAEVLTVYLMACLIGGPVFWVVFWVARRVRSEQR